MIQTANAILNWALLIASVVVFSFYLRRVGLLNIHIHKAGSVIFHVMLGGLTFCVGLRAWYGQIGLYELLAFGASTTWIVVSFNDWREGVPARAIRTKPYGMQVALDDLNELFKRK